MSLFTVKNACAKTEWTGEPDSFLCAKGDPQDKKQNILARKLKQNKTQNQNKTKKHLDL